jgi:hypothetical protein
MSLRDSEILTDIKALRVVLVQQIPKAITVETKLRDDVGKGTQESGTLFDDLNRANVDFIDIVKTDLCEENSR